MTPEYMSEDTFAEHEEDIRDAIRLLFNNSASRERLRALRLQEEGSGETVAEVFPILTLQGMVVVYTPRGRRRRVGKSGIYVRASRGIENRILAPLTGDPDQRFPIVGHTHATLAVSGRDIAAWITAGDKQVVLSAPTPDLRPPSPTAQMALWLADHVSDISRMPQAGEIFSDVAQLHEDILRVLTEE